MTKDEFLLELERSLASLPLAEKEKTLLYYREIIEDRVEEGNPEEEAVAGLGSVSGIASGIISEMADATRTTGATGTDPRDAEGGVVAGPEKRMPLQNAGAGRRALVITLIVLGSPVWLGIGVAIAAVAAGVAITLVAILFSLYAIIVSVMLTVTAVAWSLVATLFSIVIGFVAAGIVALPAFFLWVSDYPAGALFSLGGGLVLLAVGLALTPLAIAASKALWSATLRSWTYAWKHTLHFSKSVWRQVTRWSVTAWSSAAGILGKEGRS